MVFSRSRVWVIEAATRSTLPLTSMGMRVGEVTLTNSTSTPECVGDLAHEVEVEAGDLAVLIHEAEGRGVVLDSGE